MPGRTQSPSSINMYRQCPRKYYYRYILKFPTKPSIHLTRGVIVHEVLEKFFDIIPDVTESEYKQVLSECLRNMFLACWAKKNKELQTLGLTQEKLEFYKLESMQMVANWANWFFGRVDEEMRKGKDFDQALELAKPYSREEKYRSSELRVLGYIDAIEKDGDEATVIDYKTSKKSEVTSDYRLQLGIYALLYQEKHGRYPSKAGIWFLKDRLIHVDVDEELIKFAKSEIEMIHLATESDTIADYPCRITPLCKWSTGQCDFYETCIKNRNY